MRTILLLALLAGCYPQYYVSNVHTEGGELVQTKCAFDASGRTSNSCHDEPVDDEGPPIIPPDPADLRRARRELDASEPAPRPAPSEATIGQSVTAPGVHRRLEMCRNAYAPASTSLAVSLVVSPDGTVAAEPHAQGPFAECTTRALASANIAPFDGSPLHVDEQLAL
jgi:hypothetical protein